MSAASESDDRLVRLERRAERERRARTEAESLLEAKSRDLYEANRLLSRLAADLEARVEERTRELARERERVLDLADRDQLTGLANRACFARALELGLAGADRQDRFALLLLDLDRFKDVNDTLGQEAGDAVIRQVGARLRDALGEADTIARLGADEFAVILRSDTGAAALHRTARALIAAMRTPTLYRDRVVATSGSIGVALFPDDAGSAGALQRNADMALGHAKQSGSTYTLYDAQMGQAFDARQALGAELPEAIRSGQIEAWFQPIVDAGTGRTTGVEALARWRHPGRGLLAPGLFLGLAEERGLMHDLFARMMRAACPPAKAWIEAGAIRALSINVSPSQFKLGSVAEDVLALLSELDFPPQALTVEITEELLMNDLDRARGQLERLAARGVRIALDDFGVGYSNVAYLRKLPLHALKLDRSISADVTDEPRVRSIVGALVELARALDLRLVAEGIEDREQAVWLTHLGCRQLQGYHFGKPMAAAEMARVLGVAPRKPSPRRSRRPQAA